MTMQLLSAFFLGVTVTVLIVALLTRYARTKFDVVEREKKTGSGEREIHVK